MHLLHRPASFDVILTENLFGDILTDEASCWPARWACCLCFHRRWQGRSVRTDPRLGSRHAGKGIANYATLLSVALALRHSLGLKTRRVVEAAVSQALDAGVLTQDLTAEGAVSTSQAGDYVAAKVRDAG